MINLKIIELQEVDNKSSKKIRYLIDNDELFAEEAAINYYQNIGLNAIWSENDYWLFIFSLLFWDIIFSKVKGAVTHITDGESIETNPSDPIFNTLFKNFINTNGMPFDLFKTEFYINRQNKINSLLVNLPKTDIAKNLTKSYNKNYGKNCRLIPDWNKYTLDDLILPFQLTDPSNIVSIFRRIVKDIKEYRSGLPDLIIYNDKKLNFCEVKSKNDKLSEKQKSWHKFLSDEIKFDVDVLLINHDEKSKDKLLKSYDNETKSQKPKKKSLKPEGELINELRFRVKGISKNKQVDQYYLYLNQINDLRKRKKFKEMLNCCEESLPLIEEVIQWDERSSKQKWDGTNGLQIPAIETACNYLPAFQYLEDIEMYLQLIDEMPKLEYYRTCVENSLIMYDVVKKIKSLFLENDEIIQQDIKKLINHHDGFMISRALKYLENIGEITRIKEGSKHLVYWPRIRRKIDQKNENQDKPNIFQRLFGL